MLSLQKLSLIIGTALAAAMFASAAPLPQAGACPPPHIHDCIRCKYNFSDAYVSDSLFMLTSCSYRRARCRCHRCLREAGGANNMREDLSAFTVSTHLIPIGRS